MDTSNDIHTTPETRDTENTQPIDSAGYEKTYRSESRRTLVPVGALLVLAGWVTMMLNEWLSLGCTLVGLILSIIGVRIPAGPRRNLAITSIVAASVLILVFALFTILIYFIYNS